MTSAGARRAFVAALVLGLVVRLAVLTQTASLGTPIVDEQHYTQLARSLLHGDGFAWGPNQPTSLRPPLFPAVIAATWAISGEGNLQAVRLLQIVLALCSTFLVYHLGRRVFDATVGSWAAAVFWLYPSLIFANFTILTETLFILLLVAFVLLTVRLVQAPSPVAAIACGLSLGLAALTRSVLWPLPLVLCPLLVWLMPGRTIVRLALSTLVLVGFSAVVAPWAVRNTRLQGVTTIIDTMGGVNLRLGNYEYTPDDRMWAAVDTMKGERDWMYALTQANPGRHFTEGEKDKWAQAEAIRYIRANPGETLRRAAIKFADLWGIEREFIAYVQKGAAAPPVWLAALAGAACVLAYVAVVLAGGAGLWLSAPKWREHIVMLLPIVLITGVHAIVFGHSRYHLPLMPLLGVYASALLVHHRARLWPPRGWVWFGAALTVGLLVAIWVRQLVFADADRIRALLGHG